MHWLYFIILATPVALLALASGSYSLSRIDPSPQHLPSAFASAIAPIHHTDKRLPSDMRNVDTSSLAKLARRSLSIEAINPRAIRQLALHARAAENPNKTARFSMMAQKLSRRDATTHLLLIEYLATQYDTKIDDILRLYDQTLRVKPALSELWFPTLVQIMQADEARQALVPYVQKEASWIPGLMRAALRSDYGARAVSDILLRSYPGKKVDIPDGFRSDRLFNALLARKEYDLMRQLFLRMKGANPQWLTSISFKLAEKESEYGPLVWQFSNKSDVGGSLVNNNGSDKMAARVFAFSGSKGTPIKRLLFLPAGHYNFEYVAEEISPGRNAEAQWELACLRKSGSDYREDVILDSGNILTLKPKLKITKNFNIDCKIQLVRMNVFGGDSQSGIDIGSFNVELKLADPKQQ